MGGGRGGLAGQQPQTQQGSVPKPSPVTTRSPLHFSVPKSGHEAGYVAGAPWTLSQRQVAWEGRSPELSQCSRS